MIRDIDNRLAIILVMKVIVIIYRVMLNIYSFTLLSIYPQFNGYVKLLSFSTASGIIDMIISCFVCGLVPERVDKIYAVLDKFNANVLSEYEFKQWIIFKKTNEKSSFGFTVGGFASLRKQTFIAVCIEIYNQILN